MRGLILLFFYFGIAYLIGSFPTAYAAGKFFKKIDIRQHGSGNVGATNAFRVLGKGIGTAVFIADFIKGYLPAALGSKYGQGMSLDPNEIGLWIGMGAILGHVFTPFLGFKGGKWIATGAGVLFATFPLIFTIVFCIWVLVFIFTKIVSISSLAALISLVALGVGYQLSLSTQLLFLGLFLFTVWTHRSNISRLLQGKENRLIKR